MTGFSKITATIILLALITTITPITRGATIDDLEEQIQERNEKIDELEKEIKQYTNKIIEVGKEKQTLQTTISSLNTTEKKLSGELSVTETKISKTNLTLEQIESEIERLEEVVALNKKATRELMFQIQENDDTSILEILLTYENFGDAWSKVDSLIQFQETLKTKVAELISFKEELGKRYDQNASQKNALENLKSQLSDQKKVVAYNKMEKDKILKETQNKEAEYQRILKEKETARAEFESDLAELEAKLKYVLDPSSIPTKGSGALIYPIQNAVITQGFGLTSFALKGSYGYDTSGNPVPHRGVDFRAPIGTKLLAVADGVVRESYNMDSIPGCYSYGQWILVDHDNGLSSLYAHLSVRSVKAGDPVRSGSIIGYSGNSGYSTGPHLHLSIFPRSAVQVQKFTSSRGCKNALVPIAPLNAYLNPLDYF